VFPEGDPYTVACALWASIHGLTSLMISNPDYPWPPLDDLLAVGMWASRGDDSAETTASTKKTPAAKNASPASAS
jgi:hypothetical protein